MAADARRCGRCGALLPVDARFCEMCGTPAGPVRDERTERVIGHLPGEINSQGLFGGGKAINLLITTSRLICVRATPRMQEKWVAEIFRLVEEEQNTGMPWRSRLDSYEWRGPLWADFYRTPPDQQLASHRDNEDIPLAEIVSATITLVQEGQDTIDLLLTGGRSRRFVLFDQMGRPAARFLTQILGPERVRVTPPAS